MPQADAARAVMPPYAPRAAQPPTTSPTWTRPWNRHLPPIPGNGIGGAKSRGCAPTWTGSRQIRTRDPAWPDGHPSQLPGSWRGRYHTDRQPGAALQNAAMCPAGPPARSCAARAGAQSHSTHDTVMRPGPHSCPFWQRSG
jgi:hypothetical protein